MTFENLKQNLLINKTPLLIVFLVIATVILVALAIAPGKGLLPIPEKLRLQRVAAETTLTMGEIYQIQEDTTPSASSPFYSDVRIQTGTNKVTGVQLEIKYSPALLTNVEIMPGDFFQNPTVLIERIDTQEGVISYALGSEYEGISGEGIVVTLSFTPRGSFRGEASLEFLSKTAVSAEDADKSVLREMSGLEFILGGESTTSPSAQTTQTPTP